MHIPDGYLSPVTCGVMYAAVSPFWMKAVRRMRKTFSERSLPLLGILSAFSFLIMMFNIPVPGGTTAHATGAVLIAILLGPEAALIAESIALIIQALFFGDGGITAIGANCFNMGVVLPFSGYFVYRVVKGSSPVSAPRTWIAAGVGAYVGINLAALMVALELGVQPYFFHTSSGQPLYCPYNLTQAVPAMVLSHLLVGLVEAVITAGVVAYLGRYHTEFFVFNHKEVADERV